MAQTFIGMKIVSNSKSESKKQIENKTKTENRK